MKKVTRHLSSNRRAADLLREALKTSESDNCDSRRRIAACAVATLCLLVAVVSLTVCQVEFTHADTQYTMASDRLGEAKHRLLEATRKRDEAAAARTLMAAADALHLSTPEWAVRRIDMAQSAISRGATNALLQELGRKEGQIFHAEELDISVPQDDEGGLFGSTGVTGERVQVSVKGTLYFRIGTQP
jgi:hypothetical protein